MAERKPKLFRIALNQESGVPVYRQIMDQVTGAIASRQLKTGDQLPTVRQMAVDIAVNLNTVVRAYRELEIRGILDTQQGSGTFVAAQKQTLTNVERRQRLQAIANETIAQLGREGFVLEEFMKLLAKEKDGNL